MSRVLRIAAVLPYLAEELTRRYDAATLPLDATDREAWLDEHGEGVEVVVASYLSGVDGPLADRLPNLKAVANFGVGYDSTDLDAMRERGVALTNTPDVLTDDVADVAVALMLDVMRQFSASDRYVRAGEWEHHAYPLTRRVSGASVGILGLGRIGLAIARRLEGFGCEVSYHNRKPADAPYRYVADLATLARESDVLVVAIPACAETNGMVSAQVLAELGPDGYLVNIARGSVVDEDALVSALVEGRLAGAGLDVYRDEPHVPEALRSLDTVVLLPHVGSGTHQTRRDMADLVLANVEAALTGTPLVTPV